MKFINHFMLVVLSSLFIQTFCSSKNEKDDFTIKSKKICEKQISNINELTQETLIMTENDKIIILYLKEKPTKTYIINNAHNDKINALCVIDKENFITASDDKSFKVWNLKQSKPITIKTPSIAPIKSMCLCSNDKLVTSNSDGFAIWDFKSHEPTNFYTIEGCTFTSLVALKNEKFAISTTSEIVIWDSNTHKYEKTLHNDKITDISSITLLKNGKLCCSFGKDKMSLAIWDIEKETANIFEADLSGIKSIRSLIDDEILILANNNNLYILNFLNIDQPICNQIETNYSFAMNSLNVLSNNKIISGSNNGYLSIWEKIK